MGNVPASGLPADGQLVYVAGQAGPLPPFVWTVSAAGSLDPPAWAANTAYAQGNVVVLPSGTGYALCTTAGTSGAAAPTMARSGVKDGTVVWTIVAYFSNGLLLVPTSGSPSIGPQGATLVPLSAALDMESFSLPSTIYVTGTGSFSVTVLGAP